MMHTSNAKMRKWEENVRLYGCVITRNPNCEIHHPIGRTGKHNKLPIGKWFCLPLHQDYHRVGPSAIHKNKREFTRLYGLQSDLFIPVYEWARDSGFDVPPDEIIEAIRGCGK